MKSTCDLSSRCLNLTLSNHLINNHSIKLYSVMETINLINR